MKITTLSAFLLILAGGLVSCRDNGYEPNGYEPTDVGGTLFAKSIDNYPFVVLDENGEISQQVSCLWFWNDDWDWEYFGLIGGEILIVNGDEELLNYIQCYSISDDFFNIDFSRYTLLIARGVAPLVVGLAEVTLSRNATNRYTMNVHFVPTLAPALHSWAVLFLAPRLSESAEISIEVSIKHFNL